MITDKHYSGDNSKEFWAKINALPDEQQSTAYSLGVHLQNMESDLIRLINIEMQDAEEVKKEPKTEISIPPGWVECPLGERPDYFFDAAQDKWRTACGFTKTEGDNRPCIVPAPGFETHDAEWWAKQPEEVVAICQDDDGRWYKYEGEPDLDAVNWMCVGGAEIAYMFPSECPSYSGDWKDSLMVNPEKWEDSPND